VGRLTFVPETTDGHRPVHLEGRAIGKAFGNTVALDGVSLSIAAGSVHALVGENGAGKSTLGRIIAGVVPPDSGQMFLRGVPVELRSPRQALAQGIAMVAQELALVPRLTVAQNVFLGIEPRRAILTRPRELTRRFEALAARAGFALPADALVGSLPIAMQQQVEILRALARDAELLVLDEPTAALSGPEAEKLHAIVRALAASGRTIILVSHFLREVLELADTVTVLRDGRVVRTGPAAGESEASLVGAMLGRSLGQAFPDRVRPAPDAPVVLDVRGLVAPGVHGVSFSVRAGEIVGLAGLVGAGRSEVARAVYGATARAGGAVGLMGGARWDRPAAALRAGIALVPESRATEGLMLGRPVRENVSIASLWTRTRAGFVRRATERRDVASALEVCTVQAPAERAARTLSGGNQQKLLFARATLTRPRLLIADEPTRGIDVGAKRAIYERIVELAAGGAGVLLISSETEEVLGLAHRVLVMRAGRIAAELTGDAMTESAILAAAFATGEAQATGPGVAA
jgi:simple sugar transport system ATP-binding protein/ribose transport system ATP-binding protein